MPPTTARTPRRAKVVGGSGASSAGNLALAESLRVDGDRPQSVAASGRSSEPARPNSISNSSRDSGDQRAVFTPRWVPRAHSRPPSRAASVSRPAWIGLRSGFLLITYARRHVIRSASVNVEATSMTQVSSAGKIRQKQVRPFSHIGSPETQNPLRLTTQRVKVVAQPGIEPGTQGFSVLCSTN